MPPSSDRGQTPGEGPEADPLVAVTLPGERAAGAAAPERASAPTAAADLPLAETLAAPGTPESAPGLRSDPGAALAAGFADTHLPEADLQAASSHFPVANWDHYEFLQLLGQGGMGAVYKARDKFLGRIVALKFIRGGNPDMVMRFVQEARAQARIDHPDVCKVYEVGKVQGQAYIAMQYVDGKPLDRAAAGLPIIEKVLLMKKVAEAMHEAHRLGIIHRDLKPANIMVERGEDGSLHPVVMDFGLARESNAEQGLTETGAVMGTPAYMAPEQARGETRAIDRVSDVYSLGASLYDLIAGAPPFEAQTVVKLLLMVVNEDPVPLRSRLPTVAPDLETIVMKCLNKEPHQRYESARALAEDLERYINGDPILGRRLSLLDQLRRRAQKQRALFAVSSLSLIVVLVLSGSGLRQYLSRQRERQRAAEQLRLGQMLAQELKDMEWLLRSARQLPLHDLEREKGIIRERMTRLQSDLSLSGELSRGLLHYAVGRGHMALHEYPQALTHLQQALDAGEQSAELHYAHGFVLGKHFEQAMYEARLAGGGDWAKKQQRELAPIYLEPAIKSLTRSRTLDANAPIYLEALISYYQHDYVTALQRAEVAFRKAPWLYEALELSADIHLEQALRARDSGHYEDAEQEFAAAVKSYTESAAIGQSDGAVYEGLAEAWVRQIEMAIRRGQPTELAYAAAVEASEKSARAEPRSVGGPLTKGYAALMTMGLTGGGLQSAARVQQCLAAAETVLKMQPGHPYASDVAAGCNAFSADMALSRGEDPVPLLQKAQRLLEPAVQNFPHFLWGWNDLGNIQFNLGCYYLLRDTSLARIAFTRAIEYRKQAYAMDSTYLIALGNSMDARARLLLIASSENEFNENLGEIDKALINCKNENAQYQQCFLNHFVAHSIAAWRIYQAGGDPQQQLKHAFESQATSRRLGGAFLDTEQFAALAELTQAGALVRRGEDPAPALGELAQALKRCFANAGQDAMCRTLDVRGEWVRSEWLALRKQPLLASLQQALKKAQLATQSPETYPDTWQVLGETYLRLATANLANPRLREQQLADGLAAVEKTFAVNPNHAAGRATQGALQLLRAKLQREPSARRSAASSALAAFEQASKSDPFLSGSYAPLVGETRQLLGTP